jgi:hypothetical protein
VIFSSKRMCATRLPSPAVLRWRGVGVRGLSEPCATDIPPPGTLSPLTPTLSSVPGERGPCATLAWTRVGILFAFIAFSVHAPSLHAQFPEPVKRFQITVDYNGPEIFARFLDSAGLKPIRSLERFGVDAAADKTILIVFGDPQPLVQLEAKKGGLGSFLKNGGALFVATDRAFSSKQLPSLSMTTKVKDLTTREELRWDEISIRADRLANRNQCYENHPECPTIMAKEIFFQNHPLFRDVKRPIATNGPGSVKSSNRDWQLLAVLPFGTIAEQDSPGPLRFIEALPRPYIVAAQPDKPRALVIAGHGLFMNCMTVRSDIDNKVLAVNAIDWLKDGKRTHVLFVNEGKVVEAYRLPLIGPPKTPVPSLGALNRILSAIENEAILQKFLETKGWPDNFARGFIVLATFGTLLYGIKKYFQSRWSLERTPAIVGSPPAKTPPLVKQQVREMVRSQQLGEPAQALARDWFRAYAKIDFPAGRPPPELSFDIHAGLFQRRKLAEHVKTLWTLASEPAPANWNTKKLRALTVVIEEMSLSVLAGEVVFDIPVARGARS